MYSIKGLNFLIKCILDWYPIQIIKFLGSSTSDDPLARASSTDTSAAFKPQPSPRVVRSSLANWRSPTASSTTTSSTSGPHNGIMSGASSVSSSNYHSSRADRTASSSHPQKVGIIANNESKNWQTLFCKVSNDNDIDFHYVFCLLVFLKFIWCSIFNDDSSVSICHRRTTKRARKRKKWISKSWKRKGSSAACNAEKK